MGAATAELLCGIQNDLFDVGGDLCAIPKLRTKKRAKFSAHPARNRPRVSGGGHRSLQPFPDTPLKSFVLPGGKPAAAWCHLARTVCRRAERDVVTLARAEAVNPQVIIYLNRLSDLLFVLARICNNNGKTDVLWQPGKSMKK